MKTLTHVGLISIAALSLAGCGGRGIYDFGEDPNAPGVDTGLSVDGAIEDDDGVITPSDSSIIPDPDDGGPWWEDSGTPTFDSWVTPVDSTPVFDSGTPIKDSGGVIVDSGIKDTSVPPDGGGTIAATCSKIAKATCTTAFKTCCEAHGFPYDPLACDDVSRNWCDDASDGVTAGRTTYNPAWADACAAGWSANTTACQPHIFDWVKNQAPCSQLFNGTLPVGSVCTRASDCRAGTGEFAYCDETARRCRTVAIVGAGQTCNYFGAATRYCDRGLTCDSSTNRCISATPIGGVCFGADDTSCGIGNTCKAGKCAVGAPVGAACMRDLECGSWECSFGKCTDIRQLVANRWQCTGF